MCGTFLYKVKHYPFVPTIMQNVSLIKMYLLTRTMYIWAYLEAYRDFVWGSTQIVQHIFIYSLFVSDYEN